MPTDTTTTGVIAANARGEMPTTFDALAKDSDTTVGADGIIRVIDQVKYRLFGEIISDAEESALDMLVAEYAGKMVALRLIGPALDYWSKQAISVGATGRNEVKGYTDRSARLLDLRSALLADMRMLWTEVEPLLPGRKMQRKPNYPLVAQASGTLTPDPFGFERPFADPNAATAGGGG